MSIDDYIDKSEIDIDGHKFIISSIPAVQAQEIYGDIVRETNDIGDIAMTFLPMPVATRLLAYAAFNDEGTWFSLEEEYRINKACPNTMTLIKLEAAMIRKNFGFLFDGSLREVLAGLRGKSQDTSEQ